MSRLERVDVLVQYSVELFDVGFDDRCVGGVEEDWVSVLGRDVDEEMGA